jgi:type III restriction enzyme
LDAQQKTDLLNAFTDKKSRSVVEKALQQQTALYRVLSPAEQGKNFVVPVLAIKQGNFFHQFDAEYIEENLTWSLAESDASLPAFFVPNQAKGIVIDITEDEKLSQNFISDTDQQRQLLEVSSAWPIGQLVNWIDRSFAHPELSQAETGIYLTRMIGGLVDGGTFSMEALTSHRYRLAKVVAEKVKSLRAVASQKVCDELLFGVASGNVYVTDASTFTFDKNRYPYSYRYEGLPLPRHYYEAIGNLKNTGEEYECAKTIAHNQGVEFWVRNLEREPFCSFWVQTASDKFYPDFIAKLTNGKTLIVEYKGADRADSSDTREKERLGDLWAARSDGKCLFLMIKGPNELGRIHEAITPSR